MSKRKEPTQTTDKGLEIPVPKRSDWERTLRSVAKPVRPDGPAEIVEAAEQELEYPADETNEG
jgi:hypothetical protein